MKTLKQDKRNIKRREARRKKACHELDMYFEYEAKKEYEAFCKYSEWAQDYKERHAR